MLLFKKYTIKQVLLLIMWVVLSAAVIVLFISAINYTDKKTCTDLKIINEANDPNDAINEKEIRNLVIRYAGTNFIGKKINEFKLPEMEQSIRKQPWVKKVQVYFDNQGALKVEVSFRHPVVRVFNNIGESFFADEENYVLPIRNEYIVRLPVVSNFPAMPNAFTNQDSLLLKSVSSMGQTILKDSFLMAMIDQVNINSKNQFELVPKIGDQIILFGDATDMEKKFAKLKLFYQKIVPEYGWERYHKINLQYKGQIVANIRGKEDIAADSVRTMQMMNAIADYANKMSGDTTQQMIQQDDPGNTTNVDMILQSFSRDEPEIPEQLPAVVPAAGKIPVVSIPNQVILDQPKVINPVKKPATKKVVKPVLKSPAAAKQNPKNPVKPKKKNTPKK